MAIEPPQIRIALFGASAAGKTTLVSSYFGYQQRHAFEKAHGYRLSAMNARDGNLLLKNYYGMQDGRFPAPTVSRDHTYLFEFKLSGLPEPAFLLEWLDYPGAWWDDLPTDPQEIARQRACILKLLESQVGFVLIDGSEYRADRGTYLRRQLDHFKNELRRWQDIILQESGKRSPVIEEWVIALTKSDLLPKDFTAEKFGKEVVTEADEQLAGLADALYGERQKGRKLGTRFLLLSSAEVEAGDSQHVRNVDQTVGLELIAPAAFRSTLAQVARERAEYKPATDLSWWQRLLLAIAELTEKKNFEEAVGERYGPLFSLVKAVGLWAKFDVEKTAEVHRVEQRRMAAEGKLIDAAAHAMYAELEGEAGKRAFFVSQE